MYAEIGAFAKIGIFCSTVGVCGFLYIVKIHHVGVLCQKGDENLGYLGGIISSFDFVDVTRANIDYLDNLVSNVGYSGSKVYYRLGKNRKLETIFGAFDMERI